MGIRVNTNNTSHKVQHRRRTVHPCAIQQSPFHWQGVGTIHHTKSLEAELLILFSASRLPGPPRPVWGDTVYYPLSLSLFLYMQIDSYLGFLLVKSLIIAQENSHGGNSTLQAYAFLYFLRPAIVSHAFSPISKG